MPAFRNVANRHSGRLSKSTPVIYGEDGWPDFDATVSSSLACLDVKPDIKVEPEDQSLSPVSPFTPSSRPSSSPSFSDASFSVEPKALSPSPPPRLRKNSNHSRRRDPNHIPRPRNAFILFRSDYNKREMARGLAEGQQNELSKHAAKVWNKMSSQDKRPYAEQAALEKEEHYKKYPNYVYAPGRSGSNPKARPTKRKPGTVAGRGHARKRKTSLVSDDEEDSSAPASPCMSPIMPPVRSQKVPRAAAQRAALKITQPPSPSPSASIQHSPISEGYPLDDQEKDKADLSSPHPFLSGGDLDYVPTSEIPELELTPTFEYTLGTGPMDLTPSFASSPYSSYLDHIPSHFGLRLNLSDPTLPPPPRDAMIIDDPFAEFLNLPSQESEQQNPSVPLDDIYGFLSAATSSSQNFAPAASSSSSATATLTNTTTSTSSSTPAAISSSSSSSSSALPDIDPLFQCHSDPPELFPEFTYPFLQTDVNAGVYQFLDLEGNHLY